MVCRGQRTALAPREHSSAAARSTSDDGDLIRFVGSWKMSPPRSQRRDDLQDALLGKVDDLGPLVRFFSHQSQRAITADDFQKSFADETRLALAVA
jgi:hypothetical protein